MKKILTIITIITSMTSCSTMQINGVKVKDRASLSKGQRYGLYAAGVVGFAVTSHYKVGMKKK